MATAVAESMEFTDWLNKKLQELNTDETVFGFYIRSILDSDETSEEKSEALQSILAEIVQNDSDITKICNEILENWVILKPKEPSPTDGSGDDLNEKLAKLLESQSLATTTQKEYTEEEKKIREAILSQYSQMTDSDEDNEEGCSGEAKDNLEKNINARLVAEAEKQKREQSRLESQKKKDKDKEDREKQKQLKEEKKEKRKTQKGERKR